MEYKMIVSRTLFNFERIEKGKLSLRSIKFLQNNNVMNEGHSLYVSTGKSQTEHYISGSVPVKSLSLEQFKFVADATRYFKGLPEKIGKDNTIWLYSDAL